eukprot:CAMPEP_0118648868 /NCGR_PEP_ID=MMETSP0785-20121206/9394_1 /TAXON_ID=91992 /ORGANISM="Bolidomonas pacifica, Strain CCMP 1866" /LENGTH=476 /DNA_ID=CAMNT_0006541107 /DNA_START=209 /DNA_END=1642 /DNA_ORIENTATION=+
MINVGYEFDIDKKRWKSYAGDYLIAMTAASFPWMFVALYFVYIVPMPLPWGDALLAARFAAPTSAGILFSMLEAAGMKDTWLFRKARVLAIFDDLDTVLLMIPLKIVLVGFKWELSIELAVVFGLIFLAWGKLHEVRIPCSWNYTLFYAALVAGGCEIIAYASSHDGVPMEAIHLEVLMPAFVVGCVSRNPHLEDPNLPDLSREKERTTFEKNRAEIANKAPGSLAIRRVDECGPRTYKPVSMESIRVISETEEEWNIEETVNTVVSAAFMVLVGLSMPRLFGGGEECGSDGSHRRNLSVGLASGIYTKLVSVSDVSNHSLGGVDPPPPLTSHHSSRALGGSEDSSLSAGQLILHVGCVSLLMVLGKMFPVTCYRSSANIRTRLALALGMCPRGEVGAGVIVISISFGICGQCITIAVLSLALNLALSSAFIVAVKQLTVYAEIDDSKHGISRDEITGEPVTIQITEATEEIIVEL